MRTNTIFSPFPARNARTFWEPHGWKTGKLFCYMVHCNVYTVHIWFEGICNIYPEWKIYWIIWQALSHSHHTDHASILQGWVTVQELCKLKSKSKWYQTSHSRHFERGKPLKKKIHVYNRRLCHWHVIHTMFNIKWVTEFHMNSSFLSCCYWDDLFTFQMTKLEMILDRKMKRKEWRDGMNDSVVSI